jgi:hypothetical protein
MLRPAPLFLLLAALLPACATAHPVGNSRLAEVELYDATTGVELPLYRHHGRLYAAGEPGHEYQVRVDSRSGARLLAVASVDGVNVISGETASPDQSGYVLDPYGSVSIEGWRKSLDHVAAFYFTALPNSYAARTGRPGDVGVIGVALFEERVRRPPPRWQEYEESRAERGGAGSANDSVAAQAPRAKAADEPLGTGHGRSEWSTAQYTDFERDSDTPAEVLTIWYDSWRNLAAQGIVPDRRPVARRTPEPFPGRFTPDP